MISIFLSKVPFLIWFKKKKPTFSHVFYQQFCCTDKYRTFFKRPQICFRFLLIKWDPRRLPKKSSIDTSIGHDVSQITANSHLHQNFQRVIAMEEVMVLDKQTNKMPFQLDLVSRGKSYLKQTNQKKKVQEQFLSNFSRNGPYREQTRCEYIGVFINIPIRRLSRIIICSTARR